MHEISLVKNIIGSLRNEFSLDKMKSISTIHLNVGILSNVQSQLMHNAFEAVVSTESPELKSATLKIKVFDIIILCPQCQKKSTVENYVFKCLHCGERTNNVIQGNELLISGVEFLANEQELA